MKIKILKRSTVKLEKSVTDHYGVSRNYRSETHEEYEQRVNEFLKTVEVVDIKTELDGDFDEGAGYIKTYLIVIYK